MPSTMSSSVSRLLASSTVMTPSLPTFAMACAIISPISPSSLAEIVPIWVISALVATFFETFLMSLTTDTTAMSMPRFRSIGFMPAATALAPSRTIAWASTVAVVVPSPAWSLVRVATSLTICAPMFSNRSPSSISLATVTPSLVMRGAPQDLSRTTLRPLGPSVTLTALARMSMPRNRLSRASPSNLTSLAAMFPLLWLSGLLRGGGPVEDAHDVGFLHDHQVFAVELDLGSRPLPEQHAVAGLQLHRLDLAGLVARTGADGDDFALHRLFLGGIGDEDPAGGFRFRLDAADQDAVLQWTQFHGWSPRTRIMRGFGTLGLRALTHRSYMARRVKEYKRNEGTFQV